MKISNKNTGKKQATNRQFYNKGYFTQDIMDEIEKLKRVKELEAESWKDSESMERIGLEIIAILEDILKQNPQNAVAI